MLATALQWLKDNPVRVRAAVAALVGWLVHQFPQVETAIGSDALTGVLVGVITLALGESASRQVAKARAAAKTYDGAKTTE
ncbi:hypothetical protein AB0J38_17340 [Streptomyces sp. NPDC050095]|uniref:hypothetical protein n=1 Tax=unclassified Streptomyces TaxID=2593676 RepID=UPI003449F381